MRKSELRSLIKEEIKKVLKEAKKMKTIDFGEFKEVEYSGPGRKDGEYIMRLIISNKQLADDISKYLTSIKIDNKAIKSKQPGSNAFLIDMSIKDFDKLK